MHRICSSLMTLVFVLGAGCAGPDPSKVILAEIGGEKITAQDFYDAETKLSATSDSLGSKQRVLDILITKTLLEQEAFRRGLDQDSVVKQTVDRVWSKALRLRLRRAKISAMISSPKDSIVEFMRSRGARSVAETWMTSVSTKDSADYIHSHADDIFSKRDSLYVRVYRNAIPKGFASDADSVVFAASAGEVVGPVTVGGEWYVIKVDRILAVEDIFEQRKSQIIRSFRKLKTEEREEIYLDSLGRTYKLAIDTSVIAQALDTDESDLGTIVGRSSVGTVRLGQVWQSHRRGQTKERAINHTGQLLRLLIIEAEATRLGMDKDPSTLAQVDLAMREEMTSRLRHTAVLDSVEDPPESDVKQYFADNPTNFTWDSPRVWFNQVTAKTKRIANRAKRSLKRGSKWPDVIARYSDNPVERSGDRGVGPVRKGVHGIIGERALEAEIGQIVGPIESDVDEFAIIEVTERVEEGPMSWEHAQNLARTSLIRSLESARFDTLVARIRRRTASVGELTVFTDRLETLSPRKGSS